ncbi:MAG: hypothetical protein L0G70_00730 [Rubrobacter sp.]|nr:hypothetical protein [Rubrobacter sp.]
MDGRVGAVTDLFDVLNVGTREDSYTSLLAALFAEKPKWAREFFSQSTGEKDLPPKPVGVYRWPRAAVSGKDVIPDLVLTFGDPVSVVWVVEAKIGSGEGKDQLINQESEEAQKSLTESLELPEGAEWRYSYLTLEGESPAESANFQPATFETLREVFTKKPSLSEEMYPAYETLRKRLRDYYKARGSKPDPKFTLEEHLEPGAGLASTRSRFYWTGERLAEDLKLRPEFGSTGGRRDVPLCQMRGKGWRGPRYVRASETPLKDCRDIHLELQLHEDAAPLFLHYETNPFIPRLKSLPGNVTEKQYEEYHERRKEFAAALSHHREALEDAGWKLAPSSSVNQLAKLQPLPLDTNVEEFRKTVRSSAKAMRSVVDEVLNEK